MKKLLWIIFVLFAWFNPIGLRGQCSEPELAFGPGEKLNYVVAYNWGIIWVDAGEVVFTTSASLENDKTVYELKAFGRTYPYYDWLFKVRDLFQSSVDPVSFQPLWALRKTYEGGNQAYNEYVFDTLQKKVNVKVTSNDKPEQLATLPLENCRFDVLTAAYFARNINYNLLRPGDKIPVKFILDDQYYETQVNYSGKEILTNRSGKEYLCHKISAIPVEGTIFMGGEELVVWVTADRNKLPVMAEARILVGSVVAYLSGYEGLKYKVDAEVKKTK